VAPRALAEDAANQNKEIPLETKKSINFTIVPDEREPVPRQYANFCAVSHTPFDFTLSFCEIEPLSERQVMDAPEGTTFTVKAPVRVRLVVPVQLIPGLLAALQENLRIYQESYSTTEVKDRLH
jgi:hypothetical protein